jgi:hypothetical protein
VIQIGKEEIKLSLCAVDGFYAEKIPNIPPKN